MSQTVPTTRQPRGRRNSFAVPVFLAAAALLGCAHPARAGRIPFPNQHVDYDLQREPVQEFLRRFFEGLAIPVVISEQVRQEPGTLNGPRAGTPAEVFRSIAVSNGLIGYYDGSVAYIYKNRELSSRYFRIDPSLEEAFTQATVGFGLTDAYDSVLVKAQTGLVSASGTPRFLEQLQQLSSALAPHGVSASQSQQPPPLVHMTLRFFPLKYAWAADTTFSVGNQRTVVPGVATILKQLVSQNETASTGTVGGTALNPSAQSGLRGKGLAALNDHLSRLTQGAPLPAAPVVDSPERAMGGSSGEPSAENVPTEQGSSRTAVERATLEAMLAAGLASPRIVADSHRNAVIIRDVPERMALYEELIRQLDVESHIIQLDATVIDIDQTRARQLGIDWTFQHGNTTVGFAGANHPVDSKGNPVGLQVNSIISDASTFIGQINALEQNGVTNIVQRPQVLTLNDVEAVIESTQSYYIPVSGAYDEDLYSVMAGTVLRVTPHTIEDNGQTRIRLLITIEDGTVQITTQPGQNINGQSVTLSVPLVTRNAVNTQAIIAAGQGLLLGGLVRHQTMQNNNKIPLLGNIPLFGRLFRSENLSHENTERLFLISPQIVNGGTAMAAEP
jgi:type III secretion protein C